MKDLYRRVLRAVASSIYPNKNVAYKGKRKAYKGKREVKLFAPTPLFSVCLCVRPTKLMQKNYHSQKSNFCISYPLENGWVTQSPRIGILV